MSRQAKHWGSALALAFTLIAPLAGHAATVLNFDDLADGMVPAQYGGLDWSQSFLSFSDPVLFPAHSGDRLLATDWSATNDTSTIRFNQAATFQGAWFSGYEDAAVSFALFYQGQQVGSSALLQPGSTPAFLASGYAGLVDEVRVHSAAHGGFGMDDFTFTAAVPEPGTYALMLAGLGAVAFFARRRQA